MTHFGWDASDFDWSRGPMDINAAVADGIEFFTHKATEGTSITHKNYKTALERARASRMKVYGAYFVPRTPGNGGAGSIAAQVDYFLKYLDAQTPWWRSDPRFNILQTDTEHWSSGGSTYDAVSPDLGAQACNLLRQYGSGKVGVHYAPAWAYGNNIPGSDPLWASAYGSNPQMHYREAYPGKAKWPGMYSGRIPAIWQYGSRLTIGSQTGCDANAIEDEAFWQLLIGGNMAGQLDRIETMMRYLVENDRTENKDGTHNPIKTADGEYCAAGNGVKSWEDWAGGILARLDAAVMDEKARDAAAATQLSGLQTAVQALAEALKSGGGNIEAAALLAHIDESADAVRSLVEAQHQAEMAALQSASDARVSALEAELTKLRAAQAAASAPATPDQPAAQ